MCLVKASTLFRYHTSASRCESLHVNAKVKMDNDTNPLQIGELDEQLQRTRGVWGWTLLAPAAGFTR
jgi:hypothetical protein